MPFTDRRRVTYRPPPSLLLSRTRHKSRRGLIAAVLFAVVAVAFVIFVACACQTFR